MAPRNTQGVGSDGPEARRSSGSRILSRLLNGTIALTLFVTFGIELDLSYSYVPPLEKILNSGRRESDVAFDLWGHSISKAQASRYLVTEEGRSRLSPRQGAVPIDSRLIEKGRRAFYTETFGSEAYFSEVAGVLDGPLSPWEFAKAIARLKGLGTDNLQVALAKTVRIAGRVFEKGARIETGLAVVPGTNSILGIKLHHSKGRLRVGVTCAACHASLDPATGRVIEGAPNKKLNLGLLLALAPNTAAFFANAQLPPAGVFDVSAVENAVDQTLLSWPPGFVDTSRDLVANPLPIPALFPWQAYPFGSQGLAGVGPFRGLSTMAGNGHGFNVDVLTVAVNSRKLFGWDPERTYSLVLRNAANPLLRRDAEKGSVVRTRDPNPESPGFTQAVRAPAYPKGSRIAPDGIFLTVPGKPVWESINAISAFAQTLLPPGYRAVPSSNGPPPAALLPSDSRTMKLGRDLFVAHCQSCHSGPAFTNHRFTSIAPPVIKHRVGKKNLARPSPPRLFSSPTLTWAWDTDTPISDQARILLVPTEEDSRRESHPPGARKVPSLVGLAWRAPYLLDGGVAVGPHPETELGLRGTVLQGIAPDPAQSLRALLDRELRQSVIAANLNTPGLQSQGITGKGHEFWIDRGSGYSQKGQEALIQYLLCLRPSTNDFGGDSGRPDSKLLPKALAGEMGLFPQ